MWRLHNAPHLPLQISASCLIAFNTAATCSMIVLVQYITALLTAIV